MDSGVLHEVGEAFRVRFLKLIKNEKKPKQTKKENENKIFHTHKALKLC